MKKQNEHQSALTRIVVFAGAMSVLTSAGAAQTRKSVIMQHGFFGDDNTWSAVTSIQPAFDANFIRTNTFWYNNFESQEARLRANYYNGAGQDAAFVAHSFGGLLGRYATSGPNGKQWRGLATVGTPHQGAPFAANVLNGNVDLALAQVSYNLRRSSVQRLRDEWARRDKLPLESEQLRPAVGIFIAIPLHEFWS